MTLMQKMGAIPILRDFSITELLLVIPALVLAFTIHELCHGLVAYALGDDTAKNDGRLSLNPIKHIDPIGFIMLLVFRFGWAKPVMVQPENLRNPKVGMALIAAAGPGSNFVMAVLSQLAWYGTFRFAPGSPAWLFDFFSTLAFYNGLLGVFNLLPIPPLDGSKIVSAFLPDSVYNRLPNLTPFTMIFFLILMFTGIFAQVISPLISQVYIWTDAFGHWVFFGRMY